jgi:hypothetical protein
MRLESSNCQVLLQMRDKWVVREFHQVQPMSESNTMRAGDPETTDGDW